MGSNGYGALRHLYPDGSGDRRHTKVGTDSKTDNKACPQVGGAYGHILAQTVDIIAGQEWWGLW